MDHKKEFSKTSIKQISELSPKSKKILREKVNLTTLNPTRNKKIKNTKRNIFRIRIKDQNKELRIIYEIKNDKIKFLFVLNRKNNYSELVKLLQKIKIMLFLI